jgi:hypothetical protein
MDVSRTGDVVVQAKGIGDVLRGAWRRATQTFNPPPQYSYAPEFGKVRRIAQ